MKMPSASQLGRAFKCPASMALHQDREISEAGEGGTWKHEFLRLFRVSGKDTALNAVPDEFKPQMKAIDWSKLAGMVDGMVAELALAYDVKLRSTRVIGTNVGREYGQLKPSEIAMSLDYACGPGEAGQVRVVDLKTGARQNVPPLAYNWQLKANAVALATLHSSQAASIHILGPDDTNGYYVENHSMDAFALDEAANELEVLFNKVSAAFASKDRGTLPQVTVGAHCKYCPCRFTCHGTTGLALAMGGDQLRIGQLDDATAAAAYDRLQAAKLVLKEVEKQLTAYAADRTLSIGDGKFFGRRTVRRTTLDGPTVANVLTTSLGSAFAKQALELKTSKAAIKRAVMAAYAGDHASFGGLTQSQALAAVMREVEAQGGCNVKTYDRVTEYKGGQADIEDES